MLRTALKPVWLLALLFALAVSAVFVGLSKWQFDAAESTAPPPLTQTETPVALTEHFAPERPMMGTEADQVVVATGQFLADREVFVQDRLREGANGYWVVTALTVDGAPGGEVIPVVRGWTQDLGRSDPAPEGTVEVTGRLLPAEGPFAGGTHTQDGRTVTTTVATSELINLWEASAYSGFVSAFTVVPAAQFSTLEQVAAGTPAEQIAEARQAQDIGAHADGAQLEPVWVGPQPQETEVVWMNIFYAIEWVVFAAFALYLWWRFVRDDFLREQRERELDREWAERWRAEELARRREQARQEKERALAEFERFHRRREREAVVAARRAHVAETRDTQTSTGSGSAGPTTPPAPEEDA
ncbi:SURF1 family cytochrome oxidase biogenesis protein [Micrococcus terreus]|uniref:SURF1 family cytochrome oxidase biogenesis protein n=1 Tax=Micrococcus terreus TaxID=574650 RepID=UPI0033EC133D